MGALDDDARDFRAILEETQAQLSLIADTKLDTTQTLILASINVNLALAIALGRQTGILARQNTLNDLAATSPPQPPLVYSTWARANGMSITQMVDMLRRMENLVPDYLNFKIKAIKEIRSYSGLGLKESKDLADLISADPLNPWWR